MTTQNRLFKFNVIPNVWRRKSVCLAGLLMTIISACCCLAGEIVIEAACFTPDEVFPEYGQYWWEDWSHKDEDGFNLQFYPQYFTQGGAFHVYLRNTSAEPMKIEDILLDGASLKQGVRRAPTRATKMKAQHLYTGQPDATNDAKIASIYIKSGQESPSAELKTLIEVGEPIWYRVLPNPVPAGETAEVVVRLRDLPKKAKVGFEFKTDKSLSLKCEVSCAKLPLRIGYVGFNSEKVYLYLEGTAEVSPAITGVYLDNTDVTSQSEFLSKSFYKNVLSVVITLREPLKTGSYHTIKIITASGVAIANKIRAWDNFFPIGMFGRSVQGDTPREQVERYCRDFAAHHINTFYPAAIEGAQKDFLFS